MDQVVIDYLKPDIPAGLKILDVPLVRATAQLARRATARSCAIPTRTASRSCRGRCRLAQARCRHRHRGRHDRGHLRLRMAWQRAFWPQRSGGWTLCHRLSRAARDRAPRRDARRWPRAVVALQLPSRWRPALLAARRPAVRRAGRRCRATTSKPEDFVAFWSDGSFGIYIHPDIWHEGVFPVTPTGRFFDKQGKVHAASAAISPASSACCSACRCRTRCSRWRTAASARRCRGSRTPGC